MPTTNNYPTFSQSLVDQILLPGSTKTYTLPSIFDIESNSVTINIMTMPTWITFDTAAKIFTISPSTTTAGNHLVTLSL